MVTLRMPDEREQQYAEERNRAKPETLAFARLFQRLAFHGRRDFEGEFEPAPVYLTQATNLTEQQELSAELLKLLFPLKQAEKN